MMYIDYEGNTEKEATQLALDALGLVQEDVQIEVLKKEKKGILGIGKKEKAKVRIYYKEKNELNNVVKDIKTFIQMIDETAHLEVGSIEANHYSIRIDHDEPAHLIGKNGRSLQAIQNIANSILAKNQSKYKVRIDVGNYNAKRYNSIISYALTKARDVLTSRKAFVLRPLNAYERRLVHAEISRQVPGVTTESEGEGRVKSVKIFIKE